jgi:hypothetical protein
MVSGSETRGRRWMMDYKKGGQKRYNGRENLNFEFWEGIRISMIVKRGFEDLTVED